MKKLFFAQNRYQTLSLSTTPEELILTRVTQEVYLTVTSTTDWEITNIPAWLSFSITSGTRNRAITITASENTGSGRGVNILVSGRGAVSVILPVFQYGVTTGGGPEADYTQCLEYGDDEWCTLKNDENQNIT